MIKPISKYQEMGLCVKEERTMRKKVRFYADNQSKRAPKSASMQISAVIALVWHLVRQVLAVYCRVAWRQGGW